MSKGSKAKHETQKRKGRSNVGQIAERIGGFCHSTGEWKETLNLTSKPIHTLGRVVTETEPLIEAIREIDPKARLYTCGGLLVFNYVKFPDTLSNEIARSLSGKLLWKMHGSTTSQEFVRTLEIKDPETKPVFTKARKNEVSKYVGTKVSALFEPGSSLGQEIDLFNQKRKNIETPNISYLAPKLDIALASGPVEASRIEEATRQLLPYFVVMESLSQIVLDHSLI